MNFYKLTANTSLGSCREVLGFLHLGPQNRESNRRYALASTQQWPACLSGTFSPATRSWVGRNKPNMIYGASRVCWWVMCSRSSGGASPATRDGGGRGGASSFPVRGRRTWMDKARISFVRVRGCYCST
jgi:hypothetical protein